MKLFFFDIDGTLIDQKNKIYEISQNTKKMLKTLQQKGHKIIVCTGRAKSYLPKTILEQNFDGYITTNGSYVEYDNHIVLNHTIKSDIVQRIKAVFEKYDSQIILECQDWCWVEDINNKLIQEFIYTYQINENIFKKWENQYQGYYKITGIFKDKEAEIKIREELVDYVQILSHSNQKYVDINMKEMNKAIGIASIVTKLKIGKQDLYAFGDGANDYEMLAYVGNGFKMEPHNKKLDNLSIKCCGSVKEDSIYKTLKKEEII